MSRIEVKKDVYGRNREEANVLRQQFRSHRLTVLNMIGSPGSGKTSLIEQTALALKGKATMLVVEGDVETERDADRLRRLGVQALQIQTHGACHLDVDMVREKLQDVSLGDFNLLIIENIGNLICPTGFDLGEDVRVIVASTAEGDDKPIKYPEAYHSADVCILNKIDLLSHVAFHTTDFEAGARRANDRLLFFQTSCTTRAGIAPWCDWLVKTLQVAR